MPFTSAFTASFCNWEEKATGSGSDTLSYRIACLSSVSKRKSCQLGQRLASRRAAQMFVEEMSISTTTGDLFCYSVRQIEIAT
jgi:hypothetical protein